MKRLLCCLLIPVLASCGDDETVTPVSERCVVDGYAVYATGQIVTEDGVFPISVKLKEADGLIKDQELLIGMGQIEREIDSPNLRFKIRENVQANDLLDNFANASAAAPATLLLVDTSNPPENVVRRSDLSTFSCSIDAGSTCGQLALDTADPGLISDDDDKVYNFTSGQFTIESVNNSSSKVNFHFNVQLGRNILKTGDTSSGELQGCISAKYASAGSSGWTLR
jgi:hypothetical protein